MGIALFWIGVLCAIGALIWAILSGDAYPDQKKIYATVIVCLIVAAVILIPLGIHLA